MSDAKDPAPALHCFSGAPAPADVVKAWGEFVSWHPDTQRALWDLILPTLLEPPSPAHDARGAAFVETHHLDREEAVAALKACTSLFGGAAAVDLPVEKFHADLAALSPKNPMPAEFLASRYAAAKQDLRQALLVATLADHGKLMTGLSWRVGQVAASNRGVNLAANVVHLTLHFIDGQEPGQVTVQMTPDAIREIRGFAARFDSE